MGFAPGDYRATATVMGFVSRTVRFSLVANTTCTSVVAEALPDGMLQTGSHTSVQRAFQGLLLANSPLCYQAGQSMPQLRDILVVQSGSRGRFGLPAPAVPFGWGDDIFLSFVLERHPTFARFVELGSGHGVTSLLFAMPAAIRGGWLRSFDYIDLRIEQVLRAWPPSASFELADLDASVPHPGALAASSTADMIFVDGGDRLLECVRYGSRIRSGGGMLVHDWTDYFGMDGSASAERAVAQFEALGFAELYTDMAIHVGAASRFFLRT